MGTTSARTKPFWMSPWMRPAACQRWRPGELPGARLARPEVAGEEGDVAEHPIAGGDQVVDAAAGDRELGAQLGRLVGARARRARPRAWRAGRRPRRRGSSPRRPGRRRRSRCSSSVLSTKSSGRSVSSARSRKSGSSSLLRSTAAAKPPSSSAAARRSSTRHLLLGALVARPRHLGRLVASPLDQLEVAEDQLGLDVLDVGQRVDGLAARTRPRGCRRSARRGRRRRRRGCRRGSGPRAPHRGWRPWPARGCRPRRWWRGRTWVSAGPRPAVETLVGYRDDAVVGLGRRVGVGGRQGVGVGERVEDRGLAGVGESDDTEPHGVTGRLGWGWRRRDRHSGRRRDAGVPAAPERSPARPTAGTTRAG